MAAAAMERAMADSTQREGKETMCRLAKLKVKEWATVKAVTMRKRSKKALLKSETASKRPSRFLKTEGSRRAIKKSRWSKPVQICQTPSWIKPMKAARRCPGAVSS